MASERLKILNDQIEILSDLIIDINGGEIEKLDKKQTTLLSILNIEKGEKSLIDILPNLQQKIIELNAEKNKISPKDIEAEKKAEAAKKIIEKMKKDVKNILKKDVRKEMEEEEEKIFDEQKMNIIKKLEKQEKYLVKSSVQNITSELTKITGKITYFNEKIKKIEKEMKKQDIKGQKESEEKIKKLKGKIEKNIKIQKEMQEKLKTAGGEVDKILIEQKEIELLNKNHLIKKLREKLIKKSKELKLTLKEEKDETKIEKIKDEIKLLDENDEVKKLEDEIDQLKNYLDSKRKGGETLVREIFKDIISKYKRGEGYSLEKILDLVKEKVEDGEKDLEKLENLYLTDISKFYNFFDLYIRRGEPFSSLLDDYYYQTKEYTKDDLDKKDKEEIKELVKKRKFPDFQKFTDKDSKALKKLLLEKKCSPKLDVMCEDEEVCDISTERCVSKEKVVDIIKKEGIVVQQTKRGYVIKTYKGGLLYGKTKEMEQFLKTLKLIELDEQKRLGEMKEREVFWRKEEEDVEMSGLTKEEKVKKWKEIREKRLKDKKKTKLIDAVGLEIDLQKKEIKLPYETVYSPERACLVDYKLRSWIKGFKDMYILNADDSKPEDKYIITSKVIPYDNKMYYKASDFFNLLNCNRYQVQRKQEGNILNIYDDEGNLLRFKVLYDTTSGIKVQNEELFQEEQKWFNETRKSYEQKIQDILNKNITDAMFIKIRALSVDLMYYLFFENNQKLKLSNSEKELYLLALEIDKQIRDRLSDNSTIEDYLRYLGSIIIFFDNRNLSILDSRFINRLLRNYYKTQSIVGLNNSDKLESVYSSDKLNDQQKNQLDTLIQYEIENFIITFIDKNIYNLDESITRRKIILPDLTVLYNSVNYLGYKLKEKEDDYDWILRKEDGKIMEYNIVNFLSNPEGEDPEFVKKIEMLYDLDGILYHYDLKEEDYNIPEGSKAKKLIEEEKIMERTEEEIKRKEEEINNAKTLYDLLYNSIYIEEEEKVPVEEKKEEEKTWEELYTFEEEIKQLEEEEEPISKLKIIEKEDESEEEKEIKEVKEEKKREKEKKKMKEEKEKICNYCKDVIKGKEIKSIIKTDKGAKLIRFCSTECMEKQSFRKQKE